MFKFNLKNIIKQWMSMNLKKNLNNKQSEEEEDMSPLSEALS